MQKGDKMGMFIDSTYQKYGIIEIQDGKAELTEFGAIYVLSLVDTITTINNNEIAPVECYATVDVERIPKDIFEFHNNGMILTSTGLKWVFNYFHKHPFNEYLYKTALQHRNHITVEKITDEEFHK